MTDATTDFLRTTSTSYDTIAKEYTALHPDGLAHHPLDRNLINIFAELVTANSTAPVADLGSGPGYIAARLHALGVPVFGIDVSPGMAALAREAHPELRFHVGSMTDLDLPDETLGGILALYSTIHLPEDHLPTAFAEFHRTLVPGGHVLLAFQTADEDGHRHLAERFGHEIGLDYYFRTPETIAAHLRKAGLEPYTRIRRDPRGEETIPRAFVLAQKPEQGPAQDSGQDPAPAQGPAEQP
ncbi:class I SAM-dependent methyltransferase [Streptomyces brasiliensis]|uniref:Methyltransferase n=1 Tax=Streptomyces brasiliensis TaxID=1954 RepID=A0A917NRG8_9ACTN|nr:class I SAM-dependent methyltransferase [Streptomyces brasiliensis]GGJ20976.1 methyltransferase [Streptomyces brasiliensis]